LKRPKDLAELEEELGHTFRRHRLLEQAVTHSSFAREAENQAEQHDGEPVADNEQLEFLGDAVLGLVASRELYEHFPDFHEGQLSKLRAYLVSAKHLISVARQLKLGDYLRLGRGEEKSGGRAKEALLVDSLEALLAAMYLDCGMKKTREFILEHIVEPELKRLGKQMAKGLPITDFKSALQELAHTSGYPQPSYVVVAEQGPQHNKSFTVEVRIHSQRGASRSDAEYVSRGRGSTKKTAEQDAARQALDYVRAHQATESVSPKQTHEHE
jgi:ribonuclease III